MEFLYLKEEKILFELPVFQKSLSDLGFLIDPPDLFRNYSVDSSYKPDTFSLDVFAEFPFPNLEVQDFFQEVLESPIEKRLKSFLRKSPFYSVESIDPYYLTCPICMTKQHDYYNLCTNHSFCSNCIQLLLQSYIDSFQVFPHEILCPECPFEIPAATVNKFTSIPYHEKLVNLRYRLKFEQLSALGKAIPCPVPDCPGFGHILPLEKITACSKCKCTLCCQCKKGAHPGSTCEEACALDKDESLEELIFSQNWKKCPTCGVTVEKLDGCNFVTCSSSLCRERNSLCYLCGRFVIEDQHFDHYQTDGPFGITCNTLDGIEENIDPALLVPIIGDDEENLVEEE